MTPHLNEEQITSYLARTLGPGDLLEVSKHVATCKQCQARVASPADLHTRVQAVQRVMAAALPVLHLDYDQIAAFVDGRLGAEEKNRVQTHARSCSGCASTIAEMEALREELAAAPYRPAPSNRRADFWRAWLGWRGAFALASAAAVVALILMVRPGAHPGTDRRARADRGQSEARTGPAPQRGASKIMDGERVLALAQGGQVTGLDTLPPPYLAAVERAFAEGKIDAASSLAGLSTNGSTLLASSSETPALRLLEPVGTVVESRMPTFRWKPVAGAAYRVSVYDGAFNKVTGSDWAPTPEWQTSTALLRGSRYSWQVKMRQGGREVVAPAPPAPEARFQVLAAPREAEIARMKMQWGDSHLVLGVMFARDGMLDVAEDEFRKLRSENPQSPEIARLLAGIAALRNGPAKK